MDFSILINDDETNPKIILTMLTMLEVKISNQRLQYIQAYKRNRYLAPTQSIANTGNILKGLAG